MQHHKYWNMLYSHTQSECLPICCFFPQEVMINIGDVGNDYEHCLQLIRKLNEFRGATSGVRGVFLACFHIPCDARSSS